jgi:hypothetical protein
MVSVTWGIAAIIQGLAESVESQAGQSQHHQQP